MKPRHHPDRLHPDRLRPQLLLGAALLGGCVGPVPPDAPARTPAGIVQSLDAALPLETRFIDAQDRSVRLADAFADRRPAVLVFGYYRCTDLCGLTMHGLLEALEATGLSRRDYRVIGIGIAAGETAADARARQQVYEAYAEHLREGRPAGGPIDLRLFVGEPGAVATLARSAGFGAAVGATVGAAPTPRPEHAAGFVVVTPQGRTSRYFQGVVVDARDLRLALVDAGAGRIGTLADRLVLLCSHVDPATGRYSGAVMNVVRAVGAALALGLGGWIWLHRRPPRPREPFR